MRNLIRKHETTAYVLICCTLVAITMLIPGWTGVMR